MPKLPNVPLPLALVVSLAACSEDLPAEVETDLVGPSSSGEPQGTVDSTTVADPSAADETAVASTCGNGEVDADEQCDDGINDGSYGGCLPDCSAPAGRCGDGVTQSSEGEACDDGDDIDGDGCNVDCRESGAVIWEHTLPRGGTAYDVDVALDGATYVAGQADALAGPSAWAARLDQADGSVTWTYELAPSGANSEAFFTGAAQGEDGVILGGRYDAHGSLHVLDADGGLVHALPTPGVSGVYHVAVLPDGDFLVTDQWTAYRIDDLVQEWATDVGLGLAYRTSDDVALVAVNSPAGFRRFTLAGDAFEAVTLPVPDDVWALGETVAWTSDADVVLAGRVLRGDAQEALVVRSSVEGEIQWMYGPQELLEQYRQVICLAVDSGDRIVVGGFTMLLGESRPFLMKLSADGEVLWTRSLEFDATGASIHGCTATPSDEILVVGQAGNKIWFAKLAP